MKKLSVGASVFLLFSALSASASAEIPDAAPPPEIDTGDHGGPVTPEQRQKELDDLKTFNAAQSETARQQIEANARAREDFEHRDAEYKAQLEAANAAQAKYEADMEVWRRRVAACEAGDRRGCEGR